MKEVANRSALYVIPREPFKKWAKLYDEELNGDLKDRLNEKHVYLIDFFYQEDLKDVLEPYYLEIFEYELKNWNYLKKEWPENRNIAVFLDWFEVIFCDDIFDLGTEQMEIEETDIF